MEELLARDLLEIGNLSVTGRQLLEIGAAVGGLCLLGWILLRRVLPRFYGREDTSAELRPRARRVILSAVVTFSLIAILRVLELDYSLYEVELHDRINIRISTIMKALLTLVVAGLLDWSIEEFLVQRYHRSRRKDRGAPSSQDMARRISRAVSPVVYTAALLVITIDVGLGDYAFVHGTNSEGDDRRFLLQNVIAAILVFFIVRLLILLVTRFVLAGYYRRAKLDVGSQFALDRLLTYFAYLIGILLVLQTAGFSLLGIWTGAAALLVGIGIGLQQTFNDLICGVIILFERSVKVGDVVDMGGPEKVGIVRKIGARTSRVETRDNILLYVPNSKLIGESVVNWSQPRRRARFHLLVGVAYGSDTSLVKKALLEAADKHGKVAKNPKPIVRFVDFADSSLNFDLLFFTDDFLRIEDIRSDLRFLIDAAFRSYGIQIPFPQRDLWLRNAPVLTGEEVNEAPTEIEAEEDAPPPEPKPDEG